MLMENKHHQEHHVFHFALFLNILNHQKGKIGNYKGDQIARFLLNIVTSNFNVTYLLDFLLTVYILLSHPNIVFH